MLFVCYKPCSCAFTKGPFPPKYMTENNLTNACFRCFLSRAIKTISRSRSQVIKANLGQRSLFTIQAQATEPINYLAQRKSREGLVDMYIPRHIRLIAEKQRHALPAAAALAGRVHKHAVHLHSARASRSLPQSQSLSLATH